MFVQRSILHIIIPYFLYFANAEEVIQIDCSINDEDSLHVVSEKFLSLSIDPAVLLAGINLSDKSLLLAEFLCPAYIRIAGPSTDFVRYVNNEEQSEDQLSEDGNVVFVTPWMWFGFNEWLKMANLTPVFGISDVETINGAWDSKATLPLLDISDKLNVSCYWMLGYDPSRKSEAQYKEDLFIFQRTIDTFPGRNHSWKIVGSDISRVPVASGSDILEDLKDVVAAVMWEPDTSEYSFPGSSVDQNLMNGLKKTPVKIWTSAPRSSTPISFSSALRWAEQIGDAAKMGFDVVFRQPRAHELFSDTPVYWLSLLHKKLMGCNVLDAKVSTNHSGLSVYAHCTRKQTNFNEVGSMTVMVINKNSQNYIINLAINLSSENFVDIESYILTSLGENSTDIFLNGEQLTPRFLSKKDPFVPELYVSKTKEYVALKVPPISVCFFVIPKAGMSVCYKEQCVSSSSPQITVSEESLPVSVELDSKFRQSSSVNKSPLLVETRNTIMKEMETDEKLRKNNLKLKVTSLKQGESLENLTNEEQRRQIALMKRRNELKKIVAAKFHNNNEYKQDNLTSEETKQIIKEQARAKAAIRNVDLTETELDIIVETVIRKFLNSSEKTHEKSQIGIENIKKSRQNRDVNTKLLNLRSKLEDNRQWLDEKRSNIIGNTKNLKRNLKDRVRKIKQKNYRYKRDINMELLKSITDDPKKDTQKNFNTRSKNFPRNIGEKVIRTPGKSDDLFATLREKDESVDSSDIKPAKSKNIFDKKSRINHFPFRKSTDNIFKTKYKKINEDSIEIEDMNSSLDDFFGTKYNLPCIQEYFGTSNKKQDDPVNSIHRKLKKLKKQKMDDNSREYLRDSMEYFRKKRDINIKDDRYFEKIDQNYQRNTPTSKENDSAYLKSELIYPTHDGESLENKVDDALDGDFQIHDQAKQIRKKRNHQVKIYEVPITLPNEKLSERSNNQMMLKDHLTNLDAVKDKLLVSADMKRKKYSELNMKKTGSKVKGKDIIKNTSEKIQLLKQKLNLKKDAKEELPKQTNRSGRDKIVQKIKSRISEIKGNVKDAPENETEDNLGHQNVKINENSTPTIIKRSLDYKNNVFGSYKAITPNIKAWRPSDILSLERKMNFISDPNLQPLHNVEIIKNQITPSQYLNARMKRNNFNDFDNKIDSYMNDIEAIYTLPTVKTHDDNVVAHKDDENDKVSIPPNSMKATPTKIIEPETRSNMDNSANDNINYISTSKNIQKIPKETASKMEETIFDSIVSGMSGFFTNIGESFRNYLKVL